MSSYQGGHVEYFKYMLDLLRERGARAHQGVRRRRRGDRAGGDRGAARLRRGADLLAGGRRAHGPAGNDHRHDPQPRTATSPRSCRRASTKIFRGSLRELARVITGLESATLPEPLRRAAKRAAEHDACRCSVSPGPAGRASRRSPTNWSAASASTRTMRSRSRSSAVDPSRRKTGGALLGDRIRMNAINHPNIYMRSLATRDAGSEIAACLPDVIAACKCAGFDLVLVETSGIGQGDAAIVAACRFLALRDDAGVRCRQPAREDRHARLRRLRGDQQVRPPRCAGRAARRAQAGAAQPRRLRGGRRGDAGIRHHCLALQRRRRDRALSGAGRAAGRQRPEARAGARSPRSTTRHSTGRNTIVPGARVRYLAEIAEALRAYHRWAQEQSRIARERQQLAAARALLAARATPGKDAGGDATSVALAAACRPSTRRSSTRGPGSSSTCGRRRAPPTPATSTS